MSFNTPAFLFAIGCCLISLIIAGIAANKKGREWLASLNHPDNSFLPKVMPILGVAFYSSFGYGLYHLFVSSDIVPVILVVAVIQINGIVAFLLYKIKRLKLFLVACLSIPTLLIAIIFYLVQINLMMAMIPAAYLLWLIYDFSYFYRLLKLNK
jgi:tryptophan-rich sensory protein